MDDDNTIYDLLSAVLEDEGYQVMRAANVSVKLTCLRQSPELSQPILLDLAMPVMNSEQCRTAQQDPRWQHFPWWCSRPIAMQTSTRRHCVRQRSRPGHSSCPTPNSEQQD